MLQRRRRDVWLAALAALLIGCAGHGAGPIVGGAGPADPGAAATPPTAEPEAGAEPAPEPSAEPAPDRAAGRTASQRRGSGGRNADRHLEAPYVIMISFDGFRHDFLEAVETPAFDRVTREGARAVSLVPVFPTKTFPNHYTLATGMYPARHGLVDNIFWDPDLAEGYDLRDRDAVEDGRWYGGEPIWVTAETQGMVSAAYFWVGTEADVGGVRPTFWYRYDGNVTNRERVDQALAWLRLPERERPHLITLYFSDVDDAGHRYGPDSREARAAVRRVDAVLGRLLDGLERLPIADRVHLVLVSDHGMATVDPARTYALSRHVDLEGVRTVGGGPYLTLHFRGDTARLEATRRRLSRALPHASVLRIAETPVRWGYRDNPRLGDLLVLGELPWMVVRDPDDAEGAPAGHHGWDPAHDEMHGIFLASGLRIRAGALIPSVESVHVYPLVAHLLGLEPNPAIDGSLDELRSILK